MALGIYWKTDLIGILYTNIDSSTFHSFVLYATYCSYLSTAQHSHVPSEYVAIPWMMHVTTSFTHSMSIIYNHAYCADQKLI